MLEIVKIPLKVKVDHHHHLQFNIYVMCNDSMEFSSFIPRYRNFYRSYIFQSAIRELSSKVISISFHLSSFPFAVSMADSSL